MRLMSQIVVVFRTVCLGELLGSCKLIQRFCELNSEFKWNSQNMQHQHGVNVRSAGWISRPSSEAVRLRPESLSLPSSFLTSNYLWYTYAWVLKTLWWCEGFMNSILAFEPAWSHWLDSQFRQKLCISESRASTRSTHRVARDTGV